MATTKQTVIGKIISRGLHNIYTQKLNADSTAYGDELVKWTGHTEFTFTPTRTATELASGDDPAWWKKKGLVVGEVKMKFHHIAVEHMEKLLGVKYSEADGLCVGDTDDPENWLGLMVERTVEEEQGATQSKNKTILYKVDFDLPAINAATISKEDNAIAELELTGNAYPVFFDKADGTTGARTYCTINSLKNKTKYAANENGIVFPSEFTPDPVKTALAAEPTEQVAVSDKPE